MFTSEATTAYPAYERRIWATENRLKEDPDQVHDPIDGENGKYEHSYDGDGNYSYQLRPCFPYTSHNLTAAEGDFSFGSRCRLTGALGDFFMEHQSRIQNGTKRLEST